MGPSKDGSMRNIKLIRNGKQKAEIDFYDFLLSGKKPKDFRLQREDIILYHKEVKLFQYPRNTQKQDF